VTEETQAVKDLITRVMSKLTVDKFNTQRCKTVLRQNPHQIDVLGSSRLFDDNCTICTDNFVQDQKIMLTPCNHSFCERCILEWIKVQSIKVVRDQIRNKD
jgi:hypothetical protein